MHIRNINRRMIKGFFIFDHTDGKVSNVPVRHASDDSAKYGLNEASM